MRKAKLTDEELDSLMGELGSKLYTHTNLVTPNMDAAFREPARLFLKQAKAYMAPAASLPFGSREAYYACLPGKLTKETVDAVHTHDDMYLNSAFLTGHGSYDELCEVSIGTGTSVLGYETDVVLKENKLEALKGYTPQIMAAAIDILDEDESRD